MEILLVAATRFEVQPLLNQMETCGNLSDKVFVCTYKKLQIDILITGVGMVATAYHTGVQLGNKYDFVLNIGICGSFNRNLEIGSVVDVFEDCFSELGAENGDEFLTLAELNLEGVTAIKNKSSLVSNAVLDLLPKANGITVNTAHGNEKNIEKVFQKFHPVVESMEGAAFMFACENKNIPYVQIRAVSNYVERRNKELWNIPLAIENLNKKVIEILTAFK